MKKYLLVLFLVSAVAVLSLVCVDSSSTSSKHTTPTHTVTCWNSNDGTCGSPWQGSSEEFYFNSEYKATVASGQHIDITVTEGYYTVDIYLTDNTFVGEALTDVLINDDWYVWGGCADGTHPTTKSELEKSAENGIGTGASPAE